MRGILLAAIMVSVIGGCATAPNTQPIPPTTRIFDLPPLNEVRSVEIGETLLKKGKIFEYQAIRLSEKVQASSGLIGELTLTLEPQVLVARGEDDKWAYYSATKMTWYDASNIHMKKPVPIKGGLVLSRFGKKEIKLFYGSGWVRFLDLNHKPLLGHERVKAVDKPNFEQELIYNGKSGKTVNFVYREFSKSFIRSGFTQNVQYDLSESKIIGFKGARVEVIGATNTKLKYRVLKSFPLPPS